MDEAFNNPALLRERSDPAPSKMDSDDAGRERIATVRSNKTASQRSIREKSTKELLLDTAERLIGLRGFDGTSLREISTAAGQRNCGAVQYHFNSKQRLFDAVMHRAVKRSDQNRRTLFAKLEENNDKCDLSLKDLLRLLWEPDLAFKDGNGRHTLCWFMLQYVLQPNSVSHPYYTRHPLSGQVFENSSEEKPCLIELSHLLREKCVHLTDKEFIERMSRLCFMFLCSIIEMDNRVDRDVGPDCEFSVLSAIVDMAAGALLAPPSRV